MILWFSIYTLFFLGLFLQTPNPGLPSVSHFTKNDLGSTPSGSAYSFFLLPILSFPFCFWDCILQWHEELAEPTIMHGVVRNHPDILHIPSPDGRNEITDLPLRQFHLLWLNASTLPKDSELTEPPTPANPKHMLMTAQDQEFLFKASCNFNFFQKWTKSMLRTFKLSIWKLLKLFWKFYSIL